MTSSELRQILIGKPGATEGTAWGPEHLVYKVQGKLFAVVGRDHEPLRISLKCDPERAEGLRRVFAAVTPAPYFNKRHWNLVLLDGTVPDGELRAMIDESYDLVFRGLTRAQRDAVGR
jgi:predicted DNA-binding protein (MmcQ/YjbR family)